MWDLPRITPRAFLRGDSVGLIVTKDFHQIADGRSSRVITGVARCETCYRIDFSALSKDKGRSGESGIKRRLI